MKFSKAQIKKLSEANKFYCGSLVKYRRSFGHDFTFGLIVEILSPSKAYSEDEIWLKFYRLKDNVIEGEWVLHDTERDLLLSSGTLVSDDIIILETQES